jgi:archaellum component FlaC
MAQAKLGGEDMSVIEDLQNRINALQNQYNVDTTNLRKQVQDVTAIVKQREATIATLEAQMSVKPTKLNPGLYQV